MGRWLTRCRQRDVAILADNGQFRLLRLRARERESQAVSAARQHGTCWQSVDECNKFVIDQNSEGAFDINWGGFSLLRPDFDGSGDFPANLFQQPKLVSLGDTKRLRDGRALGGLRQQALEEGQRCTPVEGLGL